MNIKYLNDDVAILETNHGDEVLYSCGVAVAGYKKYLGWFKSESEHTEQTANYISEYLENKQDVLIMSLAAIEIMFLENM